MKIREGAYYRARNGAIYGPMLHVKSPIRYPFKIAGVDYEWGVDGFYQSDLQPTQFDLISEVYVSDTPPADAPAPETIRLDPRTEWKLFRQIGPHELVTNASVPMLETKTLRDEFAGYAIIGLLAVGDCHAFNRDEMAVEAYRQANAMMEARKK
jgi:hypothetical protein